MIPPLSFTRRFSHGYTRDGHDAKKKRLPPGAVRHKLLSDDDVGDILDGLKPWRTIYFRKVRKSSVSGNSEGGSTD